jgi:DNA-binding CsgD family transcriptional regulator
MSPWSSAAGVRRLVGNAKIRPQSFAKVIGPDGDEIATCFSSRLQSFRAQSIGTGRIELPASRPQSGRSTRLSYVPSLPGYARGAAVVSRPRFANPDRGREPLLVLQRCEHVEYLRQGLELAHKLGATALEQQAQTELAATGARPRRLMLSGLDSLTPSERRVAEMAAESMTNKDIAQALFVTPKTVEVHLSSVYRKLEISSRAQLPSVLGAGA